jgi:hypothetical protein
MTLRRHAALCGIAACVCAALTTDMAAQARGGGARSGAPGGQGGRAGLPAPVATTAAPVADDPFSGPVVTNAPFAADAVTTVTQVLSDGTRIEQSTNARFYRDSTGRVRREQMILGLAALNPSGESRMAITIDPDPGDATAITLDPATRTARTVPRTSVPLGLTLTADNTTRSYVVSLNGLVDSLNSVAAQRRVRTDATDGARPVSQPEESLGTRQIEGVNAVGRRTKSVIPVGQIGNDRAIEITDERWESPDLKLLIRSHHHDPRTGDVEYRLTNVVRQEQPLDLFMIPPDYTLQEGGRGGGGRGAGAGALGSPNGGGAARTGGPGPRSGGPAN